MMDCIKEAADILEEIADISDMRSMDGNGRIGLVRISADEANKFRELALKLKSYC